MTNRIQNGDLHLTCGAAYMMFAVCTGGAPNNALHLSAAAPLRQNNVLIARRRLYVNAITLHARGTFMDIPGLSTLYSILKRNIDRENDVLAQRQALAGELVDNCHKWAEVLIDTFSEAVRRWETEGREAAEREIMAQEMDFTKLDYWSLEATSPMLLFLKEDARFKEFAHSCERFYKSTLSVKRLVYGDIERHPGEYVSQRDVGISGMVELWGNEVERMLRDVKTEHMKVRVLLPK